MTFVAPLPTVSFPFQRHSIGTTSVQYAHWFLKEMSEEVNQVITAISEEQTMLADKVGHVISGDGVSVWLNVSSWPSKC